MCETISHGKWRSLVAHLVWDQGAAGSNPAFPTTWPSVEYALGPSFASEGVPLLVTLVVPQARLELATCGLELRCSIH